MKGKLFFIKYLLILLFSTFSLCAQILNGDFENWSNNFNPDNWISNNASVYTSVTKSTDKYSGQYALKGEVVNYDNSSIPPILFGGSDGKGFLVNTRYASMEGYYKFIPLTGDALNVLIIMYNNNSIIGSLDTLLNPSSVYISFNLPINYLKSEVPDRFFIKFIINDTTGILPAHVGSYFMLDALQLTGESITSVVNSDANVPEEFYVYQNYPNPFNPSTTIRYSIPNAANVTVSIYDISGNLISTLIDNKQSKGTHEVSWNGKNNSELPVVSGVYLYKVQAGNFSKTSKMILLK